MTPGRSKTDLRRGRVRPLASDEPTTDAEQSFLFAQPERDPPRCEVEEPGATAGNSKLQKPSSK